MWNFAVGEYTFYDLAFCSYSAFANLAINIRFIDNSAVCFLVIAGSGIIALAIVAYCLYFTEHPHLLGEFKKRFERMKICQHFYNFSMAERLSDRVPPFSQSAGVDCAVNRTHFHSLS
jgi:hypothetical protein